MNFTADLRPKGRQNINIDHDAFISSATNDFNFGGNLLIDILLDKLEEKNLINQHTEIDEMPWVIPSIDGTKKYYNLKIGTNDLELLLCELEEKHTSWFNGSIKFVRDQIQIDNKELVLSFTQRMLFSFWVKINGVKNLVSSATYELAILETIFHIDEQIKNNKFFKILYPNHEHLSSNLETFEKYIKSIEVAFYTFKDQPPFTTIECTQELFGQYLAYKKSLILIN